MKPNGLRDIQFQDDYRSAEDDILNDFFRVALAASEEYWRAVGYFSSSALESLGKPLGVFVRQGGVIRLITSVELSEQDLAAIDNGLTRREVCETRIQEIIDAEFSNEMGSGTTILINLLKTGRLEIKIAVPKHGKGIYHEKVGVFRSGTDYVAFSGSSNESRSAFEHNYECVDVFPSWESSLRAHKKLDHFEKLWSHQNSAVEVFTFPEAAKRSLFRITGVIQEKPVAYTPETKWRHQDEAMACFLDAERGILDMATGTGKTRTALKIVKSLYERNLIDDVIICTNGTDLLNQWHGETLRFRKSLTVVPRVYRHYGTYKEIQDFDLATKQSILLCSRGPLAMGLRSLTTVTGRRTLLIHDEVHGLGSPSTRQSLDGLSEIVRFRLGLSATPEREYDQEGNDFIESHIGPVIFSFGLEDAIERGILAPFHYYPLEYELSDEDREHLSRVYAKSAARRREGNPMTNEEIWIEISRVYKTSLMKLPVFEDFISQRPELLERCIVFAETQEYGRSVLEIIHRFRSDFHTYFSGEDSETLSRFARGELDCLVTCHRLSEGIDIRSLNSVILFSSARARLETIQRIGRCLRTDPKNPRKVANIVDFVRSDSSGTEMNSDTERSIWLTQLARTRFQE